MSVRVTHVRRNVQGQKFYIGRSCQEFAASPYGNQFRIGKDGDRPEVLLKHILFWYSEKARPLRERALREIPENVWLACWCHPQTCHGDTIAGYLNWKRRQQETLF